MVEEDYRRKLTAILSADVEGYSRLMGDDEDETIRTLTIYRNLISTLVQKHRGRVVDSPGDNLLSEFGSIVDAVRCAVEIQEELRVRNAELPEHRRMQFRIGVNLGDVVEEDGRIYGDGVNIAARVEGLAEGGGICISGAVYDSIKNKLSLSYESLGEHTVKNIREPVRVYRMRIGAEASATVARDEKGGPTRWRWRALAAVMTLVLVFGATAIWNQYFRHSPAERASLERMAYPLPEKPSIAVLPFANLSGDPGRDFIGEGIADQIITYLSMNPDMFVIARNSAFKYKGTSVETQQVAEELGIRYVLEGSVQNVEQHLRLTVHLIDALTGGLVWAERYDRDLQNIFALQDDITKAVLRELGVKLPSGEHWRKITGHENLDYQQKISKGISDLLLLTEESSEQARRLFEEAVALEPESASAYNLLGWALLSSVALGSSDSPREDMERSFELAQKAITLKDSDGGPHSLLGYLYISIRDFEKAVSEVEQAVAISPNSADARHHLATVYNYVGRRQDAIEASLLAIRLNPFPQIYYFTTLGETLCLAGRYDEAIEAHERALALNREYSQSMLGLAVAYGLSGREEEAKAMVAEFLLVYPTFSVNAWAAAVPYKNPADTELLAAAMREIGLPD